MRLSYAKYSQFPLTPTAKAEEYPVVLLIRYYLMDSGLDFLLYHRSDSKGQQLQQTLQAFAATHPEVRLTVSASQVISPSLLPCLVIKAGARVLLQLMKPYQMFGGEKMNVQCVGYVLGKYGLISSEGMTEDDPRQYPYNADELLNFPMTLQVPNPPPAAELPSEVQSGEQKSLGTRIGEAVERVFDHPISLHLRV